MKAELELRARQVYEWAMLRRGAVRAGLATGAIGALIALGVMRLPSGWWLAAIFGALLLVGWRGALLWRGALGGLAAGLGSLLLPLSLLRSCCRMGGGMASCSMPEMCVVLGAVLGLGVAIPLPRTSSFRELARATGGALMGALALTVCRCATLFAAESLGLVAGLLASTMGLALARSWWMASRA